MDSDPPIYMALAAGLVSFLSPCVLPLVPGYLSTVTGVAAEDLGEADWRRVLAPSLLFVASFSVIFVILGLTATGLGSTLQDNRDVLNKGRRADHRDGCLLRRRHVHRPSQPRVARRGPPRAGGQGGPLVAGAAFAFAWTPCIGPTLGAILTLAADSGEVAQGAALLVVYSAGLAILFVLTASRSPG